jgi:hypothetical protein
MRVNEGIKVLCGSIVVYVVVACGSAGERAAESWDAGTASDAHHEGSASDAVVDAILDAVTDPVGEAQALPPDITTENCSKTSGNFVYAEHAYPGKTVVQLAQISAILHSTQIPLPGYSDGSGGAYLRDGYAATICGTTADPQSSRRTVTFVLPQ